MRSLENHSFEFQLFHINGWSKQEKLFLESIYENNIKVQTIKSLTNSRCTEIVVDHVSISLPCETKKLFLPLHLF